MPSLIGHIEERDYWYSLKSGKIVSVHAAFNKNEDKNLEGAGEPYFFMSDSETWPSITATNLGIAYTFMRNATSTEAKRFFTGQGVEVL